MTTPGRATRFTELVGCALPLQLAPMGGVGSGPALAAAVAAAGAHGMVAAVGRGPAALMTVLDALEEAAAGPVGVNFLVPFVDRDCVALAAARVPLVDFFFGDPDATLVHIVHARGARAGWQVGSAAEARAAADVGCDLVIAQGVEAGGHVRGRMGVLPLLAEVRAVVDLPVVTAGGIATAGGVAAALAAGADAVRVGTPFVPAHESGAHPEYVRALLAASGEDTVLTEAFSVGWPNAPHRVLRSCREAAESLLGDVAGTVDYEGETRPVPRWSSSPPTLETRGHVEAMALYAGQGVGALRAVRPAEAIVAELVAEIG